MKPFPSYECEGGKPHRLSTAYTSTVPVLWYCECKVCGRLTEACMTPGEAKARGRAGWFAAWREKST